MIVVAVPGHEHERMTWVEALTHRQQRSGMQPIVNTLLTRAWCSPLEIDAIVHLLP